MVSALTLSISLAACGCDLAQKAATLALDEETKPAPRTAPVPVIPPPAVAPVSPPTAPSPQNVIPPVAPVVPAGGSPMSFADLAARVDEAVVYVRTIQSERRGFQRVLRDGSGSGFVFDSAGKILTNHHVIAGAHAIGVEFKDGRSLLAEVVGADPLTDLAVLQVPAQGLLALPLGDSEQLRVGDWVIAIGNPFGLEHTVSAGIISAKERTSRDVNLGDPDAYYSFLQTDASINPGNSGGPLVDLSGRVVGINTAINQGANNIGFAIPVNMISELLPRLLRDGKVNRAAIGVRVDDVGPQDTQRLGLSDRDGALIVEVVQGGPAHAGGVLPGDVVVKL
ncbi:MAG TPA: trypsin-like peptidase domain-containing protein, partial [Polyangiaceae bacterium]|nr:trypsin-like peptidase domain-containing protein [Polyangiaceae bacterium]